MDGDLNKLGIVAKLRELEGTQSNKMEFVGADLRGADLSGIRLKFVNLSQARLDEVDLCNARLSNINLTGAQLRGTRLHGAELNFVEATQVDLSGADASHSRWRHANLLSAKFEGANLTKAVFRYSTLDETSLRDVNFSNGGIVDSTCDRATFSRARLTNLETIGSSFNEADFEEAEQFFTCREIIVEVLRQHVNRDIDQIKLVGAVLLMRHWCYADWKKYLTTSDMGTYYALALNIFRLFPKSGVAQALEKGWDWRHPSENSKD